MSDTSTRRIDRTSVATLLLATVLAGCIHAPHVNSRMQMPPSYGGDQQPAPAGPVTFHYGSTVQSQWWRSFDSPQLNQAVDVALVGNRDLAAARANLDAARALAEAADSVRFPQVDLQSSAGRQKYGAAFLGSFKDPPFSFFSLGPAVSYVLDFNGAARAGIEQQAARAAYEQAQYEQTYLTLTGNVALQALAAASARARATMIQALIDADRHDLQLVQGAYTAGAASRVDLLAAEAPLAEEQTALPPLERAGATASGELAVLSGRFAGRDSVTDFELDQWHQPTDIVLELPSELVHVRADIRAAESQLRAANAAVGLATANLYPQITLSAAASFQATRLTALFDVSGAGGNVAGNLTAPLFHHGALKQRQQAALRAADAARAQYEQVVLRAFADVVELLEALRHDADLVDSQQQSVIVASRNLALTRDSYREGYASVLQVLDAERSYQRAQLGLLDGRVQRLADTVRLYLALGGHAPPANPGSAAGDVHAARAPTP